ncbi:MAG: Rrf2 family transcriptional regulator [Planctomycetes bacterium]|nr:Rrf2 family transcriptional regulator [Planctomycetota bacterium]
MLTRRCEYALRSLIDIGLAETLGRSRVRTADLARHERIPEPFLAHVLADLVAAGFLTAHRGRLGGYSLARPMAQIRPGDVVRAFDGPLAPIRCVSASAYERCSCPDEAHCGMRMLMLDVRNAMSDVLDRHSLAEVVEVTRSFMERDGVPFALADAPPAAARRKGRRR